MTGLWVPKTAHVMAYTKVGSAHGAGDCRFESCRGQFGNAVAMLLRYVLVSALCCLEPPILPTHGAPVYSRAYVPFSLVRRVAGPSPDCTGCRWWSSATRTWGLLLVGARRTNVITGLWVPETHHVKADTRVGHCVAALSREIGAKPKLRRLGRVFPGCGAGS